MTDTFSTFGKPVRKRRSSFFRFVIYTLGFVACALIPLAYAGWRELYLNILEKTPPKIQIPEPPKGIGLDPVTFAVEIEDKGAGLDELVVRARQRNDVKEVFRRKYDGKKASSDVVKVTLTKQELGFDEGEVELIFSLFDRSFWANNKRLSLLLTADYERPSIEVLTTQHNATLGGTQLVFYKLHEKSDALSGVTVGGALFPGFQASNLDPGFEAQPDVHFALFSIPIGFDSSKSEVRLFARDVVGNFTTQSMNYRVRSKVYDEKRVSLSDEFVTTKIPPLLEEFENLKKRSGRFFLKDSVSKEEESKVISDFRVVNEDFRQLLNDTLGELFARPKVRRLWRGSFLRQSGAEVAPFGQLRKYDLDGFPAGSVRHLGTDIADSRQMNILAANRGVVIFTGDLGIYGKSVILDHGFGLYSLYGHLSYIKVKEGDEVDKGENLGKSGATGLADGDHLHFEIRVNGIPVRPEEWWDKNWVKEHMLDRVKQVKKLLGIKDRKVLSRTARPEE